MNRFLPYLTLLRVEIAAFHPLPKERLVSVALILISQWTGITRYAAIWSPDFPLFAACGKKQSPDLLQII